MYQQAIEAKIGCNITIIDDIIKYNIIYNIYLYREEDGLGDISTLADTSVVQTLIDLRGK